MIFPVRAISLSFVLFCGWVALRVWEMNFEVSPLPAWILPVFVYFVLFFWVFWLATRLQKRHTLDRMHAWWAGILLVGGAFLWELGLTVYMGSWASVKAMFTGQFFIGMGIQLLAVVIAGYRLRRRAAFLGLDATAALPVSPPAPQDSVTNTQL